MERPLSPHDQELRMARWTAHVIAPADAPAEGLPALDDEDIAFLPAFWRRNKVPILTLACAAPAHEWWEVPALATALRAEEESFARQRAEFELVRRAWAEEGITAMFIKAAGMLPSFPHTSDNLDVYILPAKEDMARRLLRRLGYVELRNIEEPHKYLFKRFRFGEEVCAVHLHLRLEWSVSFLHEGQAWERRRPAPDDAGFCVPSLEDALLITLAHALYENKCLKLGDVLRVHACLRRGALDWAYIWGTVRSKGWEAGLAFALLAHDKLERVLYAAPALPAEQREQAERALRGIWRRPALEHLAMPARFPLPVRFTFSKGLFFAKMLSDENAPWPARLADAGTHLVTGTKLKLHLHSQPAMLVALSGVDGSGKTTQAQALVHAFRQCGIRARYVWSRGGSSPLAGRMIALGKRLLGRRAGPPSAGPSTEEGREALFRHPLARRLWPWLVWLDLTCQYAYRVRWPLLRGNVVVCDRYLLDALAEMGARLEDAGILRRLPARLLLWLNPRPQRGFVLAVDPKKARARQPAELQQGTLGLAQRQAELYNVLAGKLGYQVIDGEDEAEHVSDTLVYEVLSGYFAGFRTALNALLLSNPKQCSAGREYPPHLPPRPAPMPFPWREHPCAPEDHIP
jgi:thymidylate kinase